MAFDRLITTDMSANIVADLLKRGWSVSRIAQTIDAPVSFVQRVQTKRHVFTFRDIEAIAERAETTPYLILLNSVKNIKPHLTPLFDATWQLLEATANAGGAQPKSHRKNGRKRRVGRRAA